MSSDGEKNTLGWMTKDGELKRVCDMDDNHLLNSIALLRRKIAFTKLQTGVTSLSVLSLQYLEKEAEHRGPNHETSDPF